VITLGHAGGQDVADEQVDGVEGGASWQTDLPVEHKHFP